MKRNAKVTRDRVKKGRLHFCGTGDGLQRDIVKTWKNLLTRKYHKCLHNYFTRNDLEYNSMPKTKLYDWCLYIKINCTATIFNSTSLINLFIKYIRSKKCPQCRNYSKRQLRNAGFKTNFISSFAQFTFLEHADKKARKSNYRMMNIRRKDDNDSSVPYSLAI